MALKGEDGSLQPWYKRRASTHTMSVRATLILSSVILVVLSLALFVVVDMTAPATVAISLFNVRNPDASFDGDNAVLKAGYVWLLF